MELVVITVVVIVALALWANVRSERRQRERYHQYIDPAIAAVEDMRSRLTQASQSPISVGAVRSLKADVGQLKKELVFRKPQVHDDTKATNRATRGSDTGARARARWPSEKATAELDRLIIVLDGWRVALDRSIHEGR